MNQILASMVGLTLLLQSMSPTACWAQFRYRYPAQQGFHQPAPANPYGLRRYQPTQPYPGQAYPAQRYPAQRYPAQPYQPHQPQAYPPYGSAQPYATQPRQPSSISSVPRTPTPNSIIEYAAKPTEDYYRFPRLASEFEPQKAILLSVSDLMDQHHDVLIDIVEKTAGHIKLVILVNNSKQLRSTIELLETKARGDLKHVTLFPLQLDTIWLRDFGPQFVELDQGAGVLDFFYDGQRPLDDHFPTSWSKATKATEIPVDWTMHGGNILANGEGLAIVTSRLFEDNYIGLGSGSYNVEHERRKIVVDAFKEECNLDRIVVLKPLTPEATRHVDMFASFLAPDRVLIASVNRQRDPVNASILDSNAKLLSQVKVNGKPMRVERIEIPIRQNKYWSPYTNVIRANKLLLFPVYQSDSQHLVNQAMQTYRRLLPGHTIESIDLTTMQKLEGALHCMSINVPEFAPLPKGLLSLSRAKAKLKDPRFVARIDTKKKVEPRRPLLAENSTTQAPTRKSAAAYRSNRSNRTKKRTSNDLNSKPSGLMAKSPQSVGLSPEPPTITGQIEQDTSAKPTTNTQTNTDSQTKQPRTNQYQAVSTYRRKFVDQSRKFQLDAFAVGFNNGQVVLLSPNSYKTVLVPQFKLSNEDQNWLAANRDKILRNGAKVKAYVTQNSL